MSKILLLVAMGLPLLAAAEEKPPNIIWFIVDDMGWNQVGYHANPDNPEVRTPNIDTYATEGIEIDRGYTTPWCGPSRAAFQTGRTNSFNANVSNDIWSHFTFDDDIGFVGGMQPGTTTIAHALKKYGEDIGHPYTAYFDGKWGIGGTAWTNTPMGMGYDTFQGFWGDSIDSCDAWHALLAIPPFVGNPTTKNETGATLVQALPGYWEQNPEFEDNEWCDYFVDQIPKNVMTAEEAFLACKTRPRQFSKIMDQDLLDNVVDNIHSHDYDTGPLFQVHATQLMHTPMQYPKEYDENSPNEGQPDYFANGAEKPPATNTDLRYATVNAMRFVDDIFGQAMQAVKDAGQWDNTIVLFTSDNGGAIYISTANNNYPHRGGKFGAFEGGTRVAQFLTGGWLAKNLPPDFSHKSSTFMFPHDWAPTLLEMAGGNSTYLLGENAEKNGPYGSEMWHYIKQSTTLGPAQKKRKASFSTDFFYDVYEDRVMKLLYLGDNPTPIPRKWAPIFPQDDHLVPDSAYVSVRPCRPDGHALKCCYFDVMGDPMEDRPFYTDCEALKEEAARLYEIEGTCENPLSPMCLQAGDLPEGSPPSDLVLWSQQKAAGPFTNSQGRAVSEGLSSSCICRSIESEERLLDSVKFTTTVMSPFECFDSKTFKGASVPCDGTFAFEPRTGMLQAYADQGYNTTFWEPVIKADQQLLLGLELVNLYKTMDSYVNREGFTEWPNFSKFPKNAFGLDSCPEKNATVVPLPANLLIPWVFSTPNPTTPATGLTSLCDMEGISVQRGAIGAWSYCPSKFNPLQKPIESWDYSVEPPLGTFQDGSLWEGRRYFFCQTFCTLDYQGTAYIADTDENFGLRVLPQPIVPQPTSAPTDLESAEPTTAPTASELTKEPTATGKKGGKKSTKSDSKKEGMHIRG